MKLLKKTLAVVMSLSLCVAMVSPAFAATFKDLNDAISDNYNNDPKYITGEALEGGRYGYGESENEDGSKRYGVEAWVEDGTRKVQLNEDVIYDKAADDNANASIEIGNGQTVELDLNGHSIEGSGSAPVIAIAGGDPDPDVEPSLAPGNLTLTNSGDVDSTISGGEVGVKVEGGASLTIDDGVGFKDNEDCDVVLEYVAENEEIPQSIGNDQEGRVGKGATVTSGGETVDSADEGETVRLTFAPASDGADEAEDTMTGAEFVNYIWEHEGRPEPVGDDSVPSDQKYAAAIAWAQSIGLVDDEVQFDELMTVSVTRTVLTRLAAWKGMEMPELAALTGKEEDPVRNCLEVLKEFFGED